jgi:Methyltransferase domain
MRQIRDSVLDYRKPGSLAAGARARRWQELLRRFPQLETMNVLDLGGTPAFWRAAPVHAEHVTVVNLKEGMEADEPWMEVLVADACDPGLGAGRFDLVISNSLLEHVGGRERRRQLAEVITSQSDRYWVQTPNRYFPIEPHWLFPGFQFLPFEARVLVTRRWPLGHRRAANRRDAEELVREVELIGPTEMRQLFPRADLWIERFAGLPKSLVAIRS